MDHLGVPRPPAMSDLEMVSMYNVPSTNPTPQQSPMMMIVIGCGLVLSGVADLVLLAFFDGTCEGLDCGFPWTPFFIMLIANSSTLGLTLFLRKRLAGWLLMLSLGMTVSPFLLILYVFFEG